MNSASEFIPGIKPVGTTTLSIIQVLEDRVNMFTKLILTLAGEKASSLLANMVKLRLSLNWSTVSVEKLKSRMAKATS